MERRGDVVMYAAHEAMAQAMLATLSPVSSRVRYALALF